MTVTIVVIVLQILVDQTDLVQAGPPPIGEVQDQIAVVILHQPQEEVAIHLLLVVLDHQMMNIRQLRVQSVQGRPLHQHTLLLVHEVVNLFEVLIQILIQTKKVGNHKEHKLVLMIRTKHGVG